MICDLLIKNGTIVDGTGKAKFIADVIVNAGKITKIGTGLSQDDKFQPRNLLDANGLIVCPGFIDIHSHNDFAMPLEENDVLLSCLLEQGITTMVGGNCGFSPAPLAQKPENLDFVRTGSEFLYERPLSMNWDTMESYFKSLEENGIPLNLAQLVGHGTLRLSLWGRDFSYPGDEEMKDMESMIEESFEAGAFGVSLGLGYEPGMAVEPRELDRVATCVKKSGKILTAHIKSLTRVSPAYKISLLPGEDHSIKAMREYIEIGKRTGVKIHVSHLAFIGIKSWPSGDICIKMIEKAKSEGLDIAFDSIPYFFGNTIVTMPYPAWFLRNIDQNIKSPIAKMRLRFEWWMMFKMLGFTLDDLQLMYSAHPDMDKYNGKFFQEIARDMKCSMMEAYLKITQLSKGKARCLLYKVSGDESNYDLVKKILPHPLNTFQTDAIISTKGLKNAAAFGTFPRIIQQYHKEWGLLALEETIARMTGNSAKRMEIKDRGTIEEGKWADITIFDLNEIKDNTIKSNPEQKPSGIKFVYINGKEVVNNGAAIPGIKAGRVLRS